VFLYNLYMKNKHLYLAFIPAILLVSIAFLVRIYQYEPLNHIIDLSGSDKTNLEDSSFIPVFLDDPILGDKKAPITIIAFEDFSCNACKTQSMLLTELLNTYPKKIKVIWKGLPSTGFQNSTELAHEYAYCASKQNKFDEFNQYAFTNSKNLDEKTLDIIIEQIEANSKKIKNCLKTEEPKSYLTRSKQVALAVNVQSLPTLFVNDEQIQSPHTIEEWISILKL
jgi:protein-disulfide isomerase